MSHPIDEDIEVVALALPLDRATASGIEELAAATGAEPEVIIASILHDIREDDEATEDGPIGYLH